MQEGNNEFSASPLTRIASDDASHRRGDPTSPRKERGEVKKQR
jgi:hypothetical protein